ncbi:hypothetical protein CDAR_308331 [Caerostris darwini]|uniref:Uncharacterized protein n=1 Tax=Caerostris darwini TaxID=1538125 RepID=A0AAV4SAR3_9ARAC|nr:hypothetical protein CDAR_308321 [Caerostris darwini]GIY30231.1 hypothetical protein CDAR_308331 [Caerostris darwini]
MVSGMRHSQIPSIGISLLEAGRNKNTEGVATPSNAQSDLTTAARQIVSFILAQTTYLVRPPISLSAAGPRMSLLPVPVSKIRDSDILSPLKPDATFC